MLKINNTKIKLKNFLNKNIPQYVLKINDTFKGTKGEKFLPSRINELANAINNLKRDAETTNESPIADYELELNEISFIEYIPIENTEELKEGLFRLLKKFDNDPLFDSHKYIERFIEKAYSDIDMYRISYLTKLIFNSKHLNGYFSSLKIYGVQYTNNSIFLVFEAVPSQKLKTELKNIYGRKFEKKVTYDVSRNAKFKLWAYDEDYHKTKYLEEYLSEIKNNLLKEINKNIKLYFYKNKKIPPNIEFYFHENEKSELNNEFNDLLGIRDIDVFEYSKDGKWGIYGKRFRSQTSNLRVLYNVSDILHQGKEEYEILNEFYMNSFEINKSLLPILLMKDFSIIVEDNINYGMSKLIKQTNKSIPRYSNILKNRIKLQQEILFIKRLNSGNAEGMFKSLERKIGITFSEFEKPENFGSTKKWSTLLVLETERLFKVIIAQINDYSTLLDDTVRLLEVKVNNKYRRWTLIFTITASIIAIVSLLM